MHGVFDHTYGERLSLDITDYVCCHYQGWHKEIQRDSYWKEYYKYEKGTGLGLVPRPPAWGAEAIAIRLLSSSYSFHDIQNMIKIEKNVWKNRKIYSYWFPINMKRIERSKHVTFAFRKQSSLSLSFTEDYYYYVYFFCKS